MKPAEIAQHYLRFVSIGEPADNAPSGAHVLHRKVPQGARKLLWEAVFGIANMRGVPKPERGELRNWLLSYPQALEKVDAAFAGTKARMSLDEATDKAYRTEYLALCDVFHRHVTEYYT